MYIKNHNGPEIDPRRTPYVTVLCFGNTVVQNLNQLMATPVILYS